VNVCCTTVDSEAENMKNYHLFVEVEVVVKLENVMCGSQCRNFGERELFVFQQRP